MAWSGLSASRLNSEARAQTLRQCVGERNLCVVAQAAPVRGQPPAPINSLKVAERLSERRGMRRAKRPRHAEHR